MTDNNRDAGDKTTEPEVDTTALGDTDPPEGPGHTTKTIEDSEDADDSKALKKASTSAKPRRQLAVSVNALVVAVLIVALAAALGAFVYRDMSARDSLSQERRDDADRAKAEDIAGAYAVTASTLNYHDLTPWIAGMKKGVSPDLQKQYDVIGQTMEQVLTPLRLETSAELVVAKTVGVADGVYRVQAVVDVNSKNVQIPNGGSSTTTYNLTLDKNQDWMITAVGDPTSAIPENLNPDGQAPTEPPVAPGNLPAPTPTENVPGPVPPSPVTPGG